MNFKLIIFDVGNTLIATKKGLNLSSNVLECLKELKAKGFILGLSTLRSKAMLEDILRDFTFDFMITMNGALIYQEEEIIFSAPINKDLCDEIISKANDSMIKYKLFEQDGECYAIELFETSDIYLIDNKCTYYKWEESGNIDITKQGITKKTGLMTILDRYKIASEEVICFGDGFNDLEMMEYCGYSIAMKNAPSCVLEVADYITETADDEGVYLACKKLNLI